jgi:hypothetical protein
MAGRAVTLGLVPMTSRREEGGGRRREEGGGRREEG